MKKNKATHMDYSKLLDRAKKLGFDQKKLAEAAGISESHFCRKLGGEYAFTQTEIITIAEILGILAEEYGLYFFSPKVEKTQLAV